MLTTRFPLMCAQLCFEDFLEAVVRVACTKTLPTDEQLIESGFEDAGAPPSSTLVRARTSRLSL